MSGGRSTPTCRLKPYIWVMLDWVLDNVFFIDSKGGRKDGGDGGESSDDNADKEPYREYTEQEIVRPEKAFYRADVQIGDQSHKFGLKCITIPVRALHICHTDGTRLKVIHRNTIVDAYSYRPTEVVLLLQSLEDQKKHPRPKANSAGANSPPGNWPSGNWPPEPAPETLENAVKVIIRFRQSSVCTAFMGSLKYTLELPVRVQRDTSNLLPLHKPAASSALNSGRNIVPASIYELGTVIEELVPQLELNGHGVIGEELVLSFRSSRYLRQVELADRQPLHPFQHTQWWLSASAGAGGEQVTYMPKPFAQNVMSVPLPALMAGRWIKVTATVDRRLLVDAQTQHRFVASKGPVLPNAVMSMQLINFLVSKKASFAIGMAYASMSTLVRYAKGGDELEEFHKDLARRADQELHSLISCSSFGIRLSLPMTLREVKYINVRFAWNEFAVLIPEPVTQQGRLADYFDKDNCLNSTIICFDNTGQGWIQIPLVHTSQADRDLFHHMSLFFLFNFRTLHPEADTESDGDLEYKIGRERRPAGERSRRRGEGAHMFAQFERDIGDNNPGHMQRHFTNLWLEHFLDDLPYYLQVPAMFSDLIGEEFIEKVNAPTVDSPEEKMRKQNLEKIHLTKAVHIRREARRLATAAKRTPAKVEYLSQPQKLPGKHVRQQSWESSEGSELSEDEEDLDGGRN